ncbi:hypothetical protein LJB76_00060 [Clostridia bacterium OttesenSCG-928-O13]|nr:hypothetical protein [Clostridia bacterium OttesenSCG-928-O13]
MKPIERMFEMNNLMKQSTLCGQTITMELRWIGADCSVLCYGGDKPHIGAAALGVPYETPQGGLSATTSLLSVEKHREGTLCGELAQKLAKHLKCVVCVQCGIHYDNADQTTIKAVVQAVNALGDELLTELGK